MVLREGSPKEMLERPLVTWMVGYFCLTYRVTVAKLVKDSGFVPTEKTRGSICIRDGGTPLLSPKYTGYMKTQRASYGALSPTLSYGSGLLIIRDQRISSGAVYGHQGFAYGCVDGAFWESGTGRSVVFLNGGASELRRAGRMAWVNLDVLRWALRKELPAWK